MNDLTADERALITSLRYMTTDGCCPHDIAERLRRLMESGSGSAYGQWLIRNGFRLDSPPPRSPRSSQHPDGGG